MNNNDSSDAVARTAAAGAAGTFGLVGAAVVAAVAHPLAWVALGYGTYKIAKLAYREAKNSGKMSNKSGADDDLFV